MQADIDCVLLDRDRIARRIAELGREIAADLARDLDSEPPRGEDAPPGGELTLIPILTGSIIFVSDLIRQLPLKLQIRLISVTSYPGTATSSRGATIQAALTNVPQSLAGAHVLVIDDILDSGSTLRAVSDFLRQRGPATVRTCVFLRKQRPEAMACPVDYVAFDIPDEFVVGYGLDFDDYYRNLPDVCTLKPSVIEAAQARVTGNVQA
jgi:hypoxanthine phosphoribosyltransferase